MLWHTLFCWYSNVNGVKMSRCNSSFADVQLSLEKNSRFSLIRGFFFWNTVQTRVLTYGCRLGKTKYLVYTARDQPNPSGTPSFPFSIRPNDYCLSTKGGSRTKQFHSTTPLTICQLDTKQCLSFERRKRKKKSDENFPGPCSFRDLFI